MAILEALACRLPAVITTACHFPELAGAGGGIVVEPTAEGVTAGLRDLLGAIARPSAPSWAGAAAPWSSGRYTWDRQAARLAAVYRWVAGGGPGPRGGRGCHGGFGGRCLDERRQRTDARPEPASA